MATYQVETDDGAIYEVETEDQPGEAAMPSEPSGMMGQLKGYAGKALELSGKPRDAIRTWAMTAEKIMHGQRPDLALTESAIRSFSPNFKPKEGEKIASFAADVADPRNLLVNPAVRAAGKVVAPVAKGLGNAAANIAGGFTGVPARDLIKTAQHPLDILMSKGSKVTGKLFGDAKKAAGVTEAEERLIAGVDDTPTWRKLNSMLKRKLERNGDLTVGEALALKKSSAEMLKKTKGSGQHFYGEDLGKAETLIEKKAPGLLDLQAAVSKSKTKETVTGLFPKNKDGSPAVLRLMAAAGSAPYLGPLAPLAFVPAVSGLGAAATGAASKAVSGIAQSPMAQRVSVATIRKYLQDFQAGK
jgi:hypothetical protein